METKIIKDEIKEWENIWNQEIPLGARQDLIKRIEILLGDKE